MVAEAEREVISRIIVCGKRHLLSPLFIEYGIFISNNPSIRHYSFFRKKKQVNSHSE